MFVLPIHMNMCFRSGQYSDALSSAQRAQDLQDDLKGADFTLPGNKDSEEYRMLIPLGYQFHADTLSALRLDPKSKDFLDKTISEDDVVVAYKVAVETPPLNASR